MLVPVRVDLDRLAQMAVASVPAAASKAAYTARLREFLRWHQANGRPPLCRPTVRDYREYMRERGLKPRSINQALSAIKTLVRQAVEAGAMDDRDGAAILQVEGVAKRGDSCGRWLTEEQARALLAAPDIGTLKGKRDYAMLSLLLGCGLRRFEAVQLTVEMIAQRSGRWCIVDLTRKRGKIDTVPMPNWTYCAVTEWLQAAGVTSGPVLRAIGRGVVQDNAISTWQVCSLTRQYAGQIGVVISPHDARRTALTILLERGATIEQLRQFAGHDSIQTTETYLKRSTNLRNAACDLVDLGR